MTIFRVSIVVVLLAQILSTARYAGAADKILPAEVKRWQEDKAPFYLVDVRPAHAFGRKHISGAINIPAFIVNRKGLPKGDAIVLYDSGVGGTEATAAAERLEAAGYGKVSILTGGLAGWEIAGFPVGAPMGILTDSLVETITSAELARINRDSFELILVDLRDASSFKAGTIPGAKNIPAELLLSTAAAWQKNAVVVLFDGGSSEPERQAEQLRRAGFKLVRFLYGGYPAWKQQNATQL